MKKIIILALSFAALFCACEKTDDISDSLDAAKVSVKPVNPEICCYSHETQIKKESNSYCCDEGKGCAPCVVITPVLTSSGEFSSSNHLAMATDLLGEESAEVAAFFADKANFEDIFPLLYGTEIHSKLCAGDYVMSDIVQAYRSNNRVFLFTNIKDNSEIAVPYAEE